MKAVWVVAVMMVSAVAQANAASRAIYECEGGGLEDMAVSTTSRPGVERLSVTVSAAGDAMETYTYDVSERDGDFLSIRPHQASLKLENPSAHKSAGRLSIVGPKNAEILPGIRVTYDVDCTKMN